MTNSIPNDDDSKKNEETAESEDAGKASEGGEASKEDAEGSKAQLLGAVPSMEDEPSQGPSAPAESATSQESGSGEQKEEVSPRLETLTSTPVVPAAEAPGEPVEPQSHPDAKPRHRGRRIGIAIGAVCAGLVAVYVGGSVYFSGHFMPNTQVNGEDVSGMSREQLASEVTTQGQNYTLAVSGDNLGLTVKGSDIDLSYDGDSYANDAMSQGNPWSWPMEVLGSHSYTVDQGVSYDSDKLSSLVSGAVDAVDAHASQPTNASLSYDSDSKQFQITAEQYGTAVDKDSVLATVTQAVQGLKSEVELGQDQLVQPTVRSDDANLKSSLEKANQLLQTTIPLDINGTEVSQVTPDMIAGWLAVDDSGQVATNTDAIKAWTQGDLSKQFDTVGTQRTYTRADGKEVTVSGGTYGWSIDGSALADTISKQILAADATAIDVPMKSSAAEWNPGGAEWKAYIDVDLSEQHARYYDDDGNVIWESDFVSGNPTEGNSTPTGVYTINSNMQTGNVQLRGLDENGDGEPDYISYVTYWMPFVDNLVAFHDASWRGSFGGNIYTYNGSHGCVNLPASAAKQLYGMVSVGTVVVVHQ